MIHDFLNFEFTNLISLRETQALFPMLQPFSFFIEK